ncbi:PQQ-binding-like beta-propeller repeat protein [Streptomyces sp. TRM66268-LWL]|uniref:PQQ-binding-like beta-propeller repeat protein n=1 Tax=Streptomyces polyasparticus TaxID=2767826 RepID=A0ABR7SAE0_9ACTN|nr:serine/threonine-protein kinase [Streptomyces polyasparticus]MBC9711730.1 PQQ-binding-like beta-propeller repeat protein [Streptomyces polyasparticus]
MTDEERGRGGADAPEDGREPEDGRVPEDGQPEDARTPEDARPVEDVPTPEPDQRTRKLRPSRSSGGGPQRPAAGPASPITPTPTPARTEPLAAPPARTEPLAPLTPADPEAIAGHTLLARLTPADPEAIAGHTLLARLGAGGMGTVYLARTATGRTVALKTLRPEHARDASLRQRFGAEIRAAHRLGGAGYFPAFVDEGEDWFATAYVLGPSLAEAVTAYGPWPEAAVRALAARLADALGELHEAGYVHRDLKPSNVLITPAGPRLIDLGVAHLRGAAQEPGARPGTPAYMAPERASGESQGDESADVYALGALLVFAATGRPPHGEGEAADVLYRITHEQPHLDAVPDTLRTLTAACLARDPAARPTPAAVREQAAATGWFGDRLPPAVLADIGARTEAAGSIGVRRHTADPRSEARPTRRALLAGAGALAVAAAGGATWWLAKDDGGAPDTPAKGPARKPTRDPGGAPRPLWTFRGELGDKGFVTAYPFGDIVVATGEAEGSLIGLDARTGAERWSVTEGIGLGPAPCAGACVQPTAEPDGRLAVVEAADGRTWMTGPLDLDMTRMLTPFAGFDERAVYLIGHRPGAASTGRPQDVDRFLVAYDVKARKVRWRRQLARSPIVLEPMVGDKRIGVLLETDAVTAYRMDDGRAVWRRELATEGTFISTETGAARRGIAADHRTVVVSGRGLLVLELATGRTVWSLDPEEAEEGMTDKQKGRTLYGTALIEGDEIYLSFLNREMWVIQRNKRKRARKEGSWRWQSTVRLAPPPAAAPVAAGGLLFPPVSPDVDVAAVAVDRRTMKTVWTYTIPDEPQDTSAVTRYAAEKNRLYITRGRTLTVLPVDAG